MLAVGGSYNNNNKDKDKYYNKELVNSSVEIQMPTAPLQSVSDGTGRESSCGGTEYGCCFVELSCSCSLKVTRKKKGTDA